MNGQKMHPICIGHRFQTRAYKNTSCILDAWQSYKNYKQRFWDIEDIYLHLSCDWHHSAGLKTSLLAIELRRNENMEESTYPVRPIDFAWWGVNLYYTLLLNPFYTT